MDNSQLSVAIGWLRCSRIQMPTTTTYSDQPTDSQSLTLSWLSCIAIQSNCTLLLFDEPFPTCPRSMAAAWQTAAVRLTGGNTLQQVPCFCTALQRVY